MASKHVLVRFGPRSRLRGDWYCGFHTAHCRGIRQSDWTRYTTGCGRSHWRGTAIYNGAGSGQDSDEKTQDEGILRFAFASSSWGGRLWQRRNILFTQWYCSWNCSLECLQQDANRKKGEYWIQSFLKLSTRMVILTCFFFLLWIV